MFRGSSGSRVTQPRPFPAKEELFHSDRSPALSSRVHSLVRRVLFGVSSPSFLHRLVRSAACLGVSSLFAASPEVSTFRGTPNPHDVPSSGFLNLSTVSSTFGLAGFFHPAATSRVSVQGFDPDPQPCRLVAGRASLPLSHVRSPVARLPRPHDRASRLCSAGRCVRRSRWLAFVDAAPLFGFSSSRFLRSHRAATPLWCSRSAHGLFFGVFTVALPLRCSPRR
jgi:hypothetical protein